MPRAVEIARRVLFGIRATVAISERDPVNLARKGSETGFVRMGLACQSERHHRAAMEGIFEGDDAGTLCVSPCDLDCILDGLCATVDEDRLFREPAGRHFVHAL